MLGYILSGLVMFGMAVTVLLSLVCGNSPNTEPIRKMRSLIVIAMILSFAAMGFGQVIANSILPGLISPTVTIQVSQETLPNLLFFFFLALLFLGLGLPSVYFALSGSGPKKPPKWFIATGILLYMGLFATFTSVKKPLDQIFVVEQRLSQK